MTDLTNVWPSWGQNGELPPVGFFYEGGDRVNEKHLDALWNNLNAEWNELITGITDRVNDLHGNVALNSGLVASDAGGTNVDVSASTAGAYVNGQKLDSVTADTVSLTADGTARTDTIQVDDNGTITANYNSTSADADKLKIAEVDVTAGDDISAIRQHTNRLTEISAQESEPDAPATGAGIWYDSDAAEYKIYNGSWHPVFLSDGSDVMTGNLDMGSNIVDNVASLRNAGDMQFIDPNSSSFAYWLDYQSNTILRLGTDSTPVWFRGDVNTETGHTISEDGDRVATRLWSTSGNINFSDLGGTFNLGDLDNVTASGEGSGGGFDADTVDGQHAADITSGQTRVLHAEIAPSGQSTVSVTGLTSYDKVEIQFNNVFYSSFTDLELEIPTVTGQYEYLEPDGTQSTTNTITIADANYPIHGILHMYGSTDEVYFDNTCNGRPNGTHMRAWTTDDGNGPHDQIDIAYDLGDSGITFIQGVIKVYGITYDE